MNLNEIIITPKITEKTVMLAESGKYSILVKKTASKNQIKKAIQEVYKVDPIKINTVRTKEQISITPTRMGLLKRKRKSTKVAIVVLKKDQKIPGFETGK